MKQPRRPARLSRAILLFSAQPEGDLNRTVTLDGLAGALTASRSCLSARVNTMVFEGYLKRVIKGKGGLHHWKVAIFEITDEGRARLELLNQDKRI